MQWITKLLVIFAYNNTKQPRTFHTGSFIMGTDGAARGELSWTDPLGDELCSECL